MPRGDGTGPVGMGPMTGRGVGRCAGYVAEGFVNPVYGRGFCGWGRGGGGRGWRNRFYATGLTGWQRAGGNWPAWGNIFTPTAPYGAPVPPYKAGATEIDVLKEQAEYLKNTLEGISKRIEELETKT